MRFFFHFQRILECDFFQGLDLWPPPRRRSMRVRVESSSTSAKVAPSSICLPPHISRWSSDAMSADFTLSIESDGCTSSATVVPASVGRQAGG